MCDAKGGGNSKSGGNGNGNGKKKDFGAKTTDNSLNIVSSKQNIDGKSKYNQAYWANQIAPKVIDANGKNIGGLGLTQAEVRAAKEKVGDKKAYSSDRVVTTANKDAALFKLKKITGSMATLGNGVTKSTSKSGLFNEHTTDKYDYAGNNPDVIVKTTDPKFDIFGREIRLGDKTSTTFVDGTATNTVTNATGAANGVGSTVAKANADGVDDTVVADNVVSPSVPAVVPAVVPPKKTTLVIPPTTRTKTTTKLPETTMAAAGAIANPDGLKNILAVKKGKQQRGKRNLRTAKTGQRVSGSGVGLNIA